MPSVNINLMEISMKNTMKLAMFVLLSATATQAKVSCEDLIKNSETNEYTSLKSTDFTDYANWFSYDVLVSLDKESCRKANAIGQTTFSLNGESFTRITSNEDSCDGGNTYGVIVDSNKKAIAHIYDGDIYCQEDWSEDNRAENYKCNPAVEKLAEKKMKDFGLDFTASASSIEIRTPYFYSFINVFGKVGDRNVSIQALTNLETCKVGRVSISNLPL